MLTVRATLKDHHVEFEPTFTPPQEPVTVLVTFVEEAATANAPNNDSPYSADKYSFAEALALTKHVGGKPLSQIVVEDREDNWR